VLAKEGNTYAPTRQVDFSELADRVVREFAELATPLMPGFALAALGALRENSAPLLRRLAASLDSALLGHRMMLVDPDDSSRHARAALADELDSILAADGLVRESLGPDRVLARSRVIRRDEPALKECNQRFNQNANGELDKLVVEGGAAKDANASWTSRVHATTNASAYAADLWFAELLQAQSFYGRESPTLALGVVVHGMRDLRYGSPPPLWSRPGRTGYLLCLQPVCDSVRLGMDLSRPFPFLPLAIARDVAPQFVVDHGGTPIPLTTSVKAYRTVMISFRSNDAASESVRGRPDGNGWVFRDIDGNSYAYVTHLRELIAQRIVQQIGIDTSRVGVDEPEWIRARRHATGPPPAMGGR
jgi:hypothetical protein